MSTALENVRPVAVPGRTGQGTAVEQSRAVAEVQAQVIVAQQFPRSVQAAIRNMEEACAQPELASRAFFRYPRAGETVQGASVHLARELARCWGNVQYGLVELIRDDAHGQSEVMAWAWDVETNTRDSTTFIVPHKMDTKKGVRELTEMRDIYENNANNGARRMREMIFSVLPVWYRARAEALCMETIENGGGKPLAQRIAEAVKAFEKRGVSAARIAAKYGHASADDLTATDVAQLGVVYDSLRQGTVTVDDEFPPEQPQVTAKDILAGAEQPAERRSRRRPGDAQAAPPAEPAEPAEPASTHAAAPPAAGEPRDDAGGAQSRYRDGDPRNVVLAELERLGVHGEAIGDTLTQLAQKPLASVESLNHKQATWFAERLPALASRDDLKALLATGEVRDDN